MRFLVDNQLPLQLARYVAGLGHETVHVTEVGLDEATDEAVWEWAQQETRVVVSKDEDRVLGKDGVKIGGQNALTSRAGYSPGSLTDVLALRAITCGPSER